jgi:hypothetical protein
LNTVHLPFEISISQLILPWCFFQTDTTTHDRYHTFTSNDNNDNDNNNRDQPSRAPISRNVNDKTLLAAAVPVLGLLLLLLLLLFSAGSLTKPGGVEWRYSRFRVDDMMLETFFIGNIVCTWRERERATRARAHDSADDQPSHLPNLALCEVGGLAYRTRGCCWLAGSLS